MPVCTRARVVHTSITLRGSHVGSCTRPCDRVQLGPKFPGPMEQIRKCLRRVLLQRALLHHLCMRGHARYARSFVCRSAATGYAYVAEQLTTDQKVDELARLTKLCLSSDGRSHSPAARADHVAIEKAVERAAARAVEQAMEKMVALQRGEAPVPGAFIGSWQIPSIAPSQSGFTSMASPRLSPSSASPSGVDTGGGDALTRLLQQDAAARRGEDKRREKGESDSLQAVLRAHEEALSTLSARAGHQIENAAAAAASAARAANMAATAAAEMMSVQRDLQERHTALARRLRLHELIEHDPDTCA